LLWSHVKLVVQSLVVAQLCWQLPFEPHVYGLHDWGTPFAEVDVDPSALHFALAAEHAPDLHE
jgi:hypothetical protein